MLDYLLVDNIITSALKEDMPFGDITTENTVIGSPRSKARLVAKQDAVIAGLDIFERVFTLLGGNTVFHRSIADGARVHKGDVILEFEGDTGTLLKGERTALNFLQHMSGVATRTAEFVERVQGLPVKITDTRKTAPGLRYFEKYAVRLGGGHNHRFCLSDGVLIKDNHIKAAGGIANAVKLVRGNIAHTIKIEVETESLEQVQEALAAGADIIMLDNMSKETMAQAVKLVNGRALTEASGNMSLTNVYDTALTGVDIISVGELTHSVKAVDISMRFI